MAVSNVYMYESDREYESDGDDMELSEEQEREECAFCGMPVEEREGWLYRFTKQYGGEWFCQFCMFNNYKFPMD